MRETHEWTDAELDYLERFYALHGTAFIRQRFPHLTTDAIKQQASRLNLREDMQEFTPLPTVAREAGVTPQAVQHWLNAHEYRRHCRTGRRGVLLLPAPVVRLYLTRHAPRRPRGWWGVHRTAEYLNTTPPRVAALAQRGHLTAVRIRNTMYYDPHTITTYAHHRAHRTPTPNDLPIRALQALTGIHRPWERLPTTLKTRPGRQEARYVTADTARAFLTAQGHREEQVDTLLRKVQALEAARVKR